MLAKLVGGRGVVPTFLHGYVSYGYWKGRLSVKPRPIRTAWYTVSYAGQVFYIKQYEKIIRTRTRKYIVVEVLGIASRTETEDGPLWYAMVDGDSKVPPRDGSVVWLHYIAGRKHAYHAIYGPYRTRSQAIARMKRYTDNKHMKWGWKSPYGPVLRIPTLERIVELYTEEEPMAWLYKYILRVVRPW